MKTKKTKYDKLKKYFGTHEQVAKTLGISGRHYRRIRQCGSGSKSVFILIDLILKNYEIKKTLSD